MKDKYYAFWKYDLFPYLLGGIVSKMNERGMVYIESYQSWFRPIIILPHESGEKIMKQLSELEKEYNKEKQQLLETYKTKLKDIAFFIS